MVERSCVTSGPSVAVVVVVLLVDAGGFTSKVAGAGASVVVCLYSTHPVARKNDINAKLSIKSRVLLIIVFPALLIGGAYELEHSIPCKRIDRAIHKRRESNQTSDFAR